MATIQSANPIYHDPTPRQTRTRRSSSRRSFATPMSRSSSQLASPRAPCPKDEDTLSYDPAHLRAWYLPQELWESLPEALKSSVAAVQHSAAAVLTGYGRLDNHGQDQDQNELVHLEPLPSPRFRTISNASSVFSSDSSSATTNSSASQSGCASPVTSAFSLQTRPAFSPVSLGDPATPLDKQNRSRERSFSTPLEPHNAYFVTELSHLRTEALPRLRHLGRKVDHDLAEAKRTTSFSGDNANENANAFENWWAEKTLDIVSLSAKVKRLADALGVMPTGMGWCAP